MVGSTNYTKLLKVKLIDISPHLKISFFRVRVLFIVDAFLIKSLFSWTTSFFRGRFLGRVRVFLSEFLFSWTSACFFGRVRVFLLSFFFFYKFRSPGGGVALVSWLEKTIFLLFISLQILSDYLLIIYWSWFPGWIRSGRTQTCSDRGTRRTRTARWPTPSSAPSPPRRASTPSTPRLQGRTTILSY